MQTEEEAREIEQRKIELENTGFSPPTNNNWWGNILPKIAEPFAQLGAGLIAKNSGLQFSPQNPTPTAPTAPKDQDLTEMIKKNALYIGIGLVLVIVLLIFLIRKKNG